MLEHTYLCIKIKFKYLKFKTICENKYYGILRRATVIKTNISKID